MKQYKEHVITIALLLMCLSFNACKSVQHIHFPVSVSKEACKGKCPVYSVELLKNGTLQFEGFENTKFIGKQTIKLLKKNLKHLVTVTKALIFQS